VLGTNGVDRVGVLTTWSIAKGGADSVDSG